jgi:acyl CoA:acetate/3-ketoacid CoA transferase beta subunit
LSVKHRNSIRIAPCRDTRVDCSASNESRRDADVSLTTFGEPEITMPGMCGFAVASTAGRSLVELAPGVSVQQVLGATEAGLVVRGDLATMQLSERNAS